MPPVDFLGTPNILYRNNGNGTFTDVSEQSYISPYIGKGMGLAFADYDNDGFTDIFVSNDTFENYLFHNKGNGTFAEVALQAGVAYNAFGNAIAGMGADFRDIDNDGRPDIFETAMFGEAPLYKNLGNGQFQMPRSMTGLASSPVLTAWGVGVFDFDKGTKTCSPPIPTSSTILELAHRPFPLADRVFRNRGNLSFEDVSSKAGPSFQALPASRAAFGDLNNDGAIDAVVIVLNGSPEIWMNHSTITTTGSSLVWSVSNPP